MIRTLLVVASLVLVPKVWAAPVDEMQVRKAVDAQIADLWQRKDLAAIERIATELRTRRDRTPSGIWKLSVFNAALSDQINNDIRGGKSWDEVHAQADRWAKVSPKSPVAQLFVATALTSHAWSIRGGEYARLTSAERMSAFRQYIAMSRAHLESVKSIASIDPTWYELMLSNTRYSGRPVAETQSLFSEAVLREPEYLQVYFVASGHFGPKWGGSAQALEDFMRGAVSKFDAQAGDAMYMRMAWWVLDQNFFDDHLQARLDCERMMRGAMKIAADYPDRWNVNNFARFSAQCGDRKATAFFLAKIGETPMPEVWGKYPPSYFESVQGFGK